MTDLFFRKGKKGKYLVNKDGKEFFKLTEDREESSIESLLDEHINISNSVFDAELPQESNQNNSPDPSNHIENPESQVGYSQSVISPHLFPDHRINGDDNDNVDNDGDINDDADPTYNGTKDDVYPQANVQTNITPKKIQFSKGEDLMTIPIISKEEMENMKLLKTTLKGKANREKAWDEMILPTFHVSELFGEQKKLRNKKKEQHIDSQAFRNKLKHYVFVPMQDILDKTQMHKIKLLWTTESTALFPVTLGYVLFDRSNKELPCTGEFKIPFLLFD